MSRSPRGARATGTIGRCSSSPPTGWGASVRAGPPADGVTTPDAESLAAGALALGVELDPSAIARIGRFLTVLQIWNRRVRLTGERDVHAVIEKHVIDSLAPAPELPSDGIVLDLG